MNRNTFTLESSIIEISNRNSTTREITMIVHTLEEPNKNGLHFKEPYVSENLETIINKPVVCVYYQPQDDLGDHQFYISTSGDVELRTMAIGTITDAWIADYRISFNETKKALYAKATIWEYKFPAVVACIEKLFNAKQSTSSVEVEVYQYDPESTSKNRICSNFSYLSNCLLGSTVKPADPNAGVIQVFQKEVASAIMSDLNNWNDIKNNYDEKGGKENLDEKEVNQIEVNFGHEAKIATEVSDLSFGDITSILWDKVNYETDSDGDRIYKYWVEQVYLGYAIIYSRDEGNYFKIPYAVDTASEDITVDFSSLVQVKSMWVEVSFDLDSLVEKAELDKVTDELSTLQATLTEKETEISNLTSQIFTLQTEVSTKNEALQLSESEANEKIIDLGKAIDGLKTQLSELEPIKVEYERVQAEIAEQELNTKKENLKTFAISSKMISEQELEEDETIKGYITEVNEDAIKRVIADRVVEQAKKEVSNSNVTDKPIIDIAEVQEDLIPQSAKEQMYASRSK